MKSTNDWFVEQLLENDHGFRRDDNPDDPWDADNEEQHEGFTDYDPDLNNDATMEHDEADEWLSRKAA